MPEPQRRRRRPLSAAVPYGKRKCQRTRDRRIINGTPLPDDALAGIFARLPGAADVVRCAAACARWRRVVATRAVSGVVAAAAPPPRGLRQPPRAPPPLLHRHAVPWRCPERRFFHYSRPAASRSGRLVLELQRQSRGDGVTFRLLLIYNRRGFTALRCYSSDTGRWGAEARSAVEVSTWELRRIGPAVVRRGVAFWPLDHGRSGCVRPPPMTRSRRRWTPTCFLTVFHISGQGSSCWAQCHVRAESPVRHGGEVGRRRGRLVEEPRRVRDGLGVP
ncbi:hypothetical protein ACP70R_030903 [Stipagrostis hirtigluma subsp. patula]